MVVIDGESTCCAAVELPASCIAIKEADSSALSGNYDIAVAGSQQTVYCDMATDGGGWMLVMNYVRQGDTGFNPNLYVRDLETGFPLLKSTDLGDTEWSLGGKGGSWGHMSALTMSQVRCFD